MRIGTWNLAGRWTLEHHCRLMMDLDVDVWLLTEVNDRVALDGYQCHVTNDDMAPKRRWAGVFSRLGLVAQPDPHPASALARVGDLSFCSSVLPWRSAASRAPWEGVRHVDKTAFALRKLLQMLPSTGLVWGGDWNHALTGTEYAGSKAGRSHLLDAIEQLDLQVPTAALPHCLPDLLSIDHIAVPSAADVLTAERVVAAAGDRRLSDHDSYVVEVTP